VPNRAGSVGQGDGKAGEGFRQLRRAAIRRALSLARAGDTVVLAGKGHETYQEVDGVEYHLDEREEIAAYFA